MDQQVEGAVVETARKLATVRKIDAIDPIPGADAIEVATVGGWKVVVKKGDFDAGELALYLEIDSWVPTELAPFLSKGHEPRTYNGVQGERLRTVKLRGQVSQGLLLPIWDEHGFDEKDREVQLWMVPYTSSIKDAVALCVAQEDELKDGLDLTEMLRVQKWERPLSPQLAGRVRGNFPSFIRKTDQERCQNLKRQITEAHVSGDKFEVTRKIDGSSMTVYYKTELIDDPIAHAAGLQAIVARIGVCSRNLELKLDDDANDSNAFVKTARASGIFHALMGVGRNLAVQGELYGEGIQGNSEGIVGHSFAIFDIFDIDAQRYLNPSERWDVYWKLRDHGYAGEHVPVLNDNFQLGSDSIDELLKLAEGKNEAGNEREGLVFKRHDGQFSFKAISNRFLLKGGE